MVNRSISKLRIAFALALVGGLLGCSDKLDNGGGGGNAGGPSAGTGGPGGMGGNGGGVAGGGGGGLGGAGAIGGGAGVPAGGTGGDVLPACSPPATSGSPSLDWSNGTGALYEAYDGPVTVEASTAGGLVLTSAPGVDGAGGSGGQAGAAGAGGAAGTVSGRLRIGASTLPPFPIGARVWLTKTQGPGRFIFAAPTPAAFAVRDGRDGTLLFGGNEHAYDAAVASPTLPVATGAVTATCSSPSTYACASMNTFYSIVFIGDTSVVLRHGERGEITLGGVPYDVRVKAWKENLIVPLPASCGGDAWAGDGLQYDVMAKNLADLVAGLPIPLSSGR